MTTVTQLESNLNDFDPAIRAEALQTLVSFAREGIIPLASKADVVNMHCHTFFSFNVFAEHNERYILSGIRSRGLTTRPYWLPAATGPTGEGLTATVPPTRPA